MFKRTIIIVLDSVGIGEMPDAAEYGDAGVNTIGHTAEAVGGLKLPAMTTIGLGCIAPIKGVECPPAIKGGFGKMAELSRCKDTTGGHWEIAGCPAEQPFPYYPDGFPAEVIDRFKELTGAGGVLGNIPASGTEIIMQLGDEHVRTGYPIVYTSADSVFQIAAHEEVIPLDELYRMCKIAREQVCVGRHAVGRIIARPFVGTSGDYRRTANRHDYSLLPPRDTMLDVLQASGIATVSVGKISDIFAGRGVSRSYPTKSNDHGMEVLAELIDGGADQGLIFVNLVEFDMVYGHRRNPQGYAEALERFDRQLAGPVSYTHL
ncbi:MAG: phosphopentomutase, partial [Negativicutes bacterium]|nr:phosphopentomutase [Negativicutes bacterium]